MKKIFAILSLLMMLCFTPVQGQSFWSNWSLGGHVEMTKDLGTLDNWSMGEGLNFGTGLMAKKQLSDNWAVRFNMDVPGWFTSDNTPFERFGKATAGVSYGKNFYGFVDAGAAVKYDDYGWLAIAADLGMGYQWNLAEKHTIYTELGVDMVSDARMNLETSNAYLRVGYLYNFGLTKDDRAIEAQRKMLEEQQYAQMMYLDSVSHAHEACPAREKELLERITALENQQAHIVVMNTIENNHSQVLDSIINDIKANQDVMYALPFSIEFPLNSYTIPANQKYRLEQIAHIMMNDSTSTFTVAGYCDASGSDEYNQTLSEKRAQAVADELINLGVKEDQLVVTGKGKKIAFGDLESKINRRVSFFKNLD